MAVTSIFIIVSRPDRGSVCPEGVGVSANRVHPEADGAVGRGGGDQAARGGRVRDAVHRCRVAGKLESLKYTQFSL